MREDNNINLNALMHCFIGKKGVSYELNVVGESAKLKIEGEKNDGTNFKTKWDFGNGIAWGRYWEDGWQGKNTFQYNYCNESDFLEICQKIAKIVNQ